MSENNIGETGETGETTESVDMQDGQEWGDSVDDASGTPSEPPSSEVPPSENATPVLFTPESSSESEEQIPDELRELISVSGVRLVRCENTWNVEGWAAKLRKNLSVTFTIDEDITGEDIMDGFEHAGFDTSTIVAIQRRISNRSWVISFSEQCEKDRVISKGRLKIKNTVVFLGDADSRTDIVKIFESPDEMPDTVIIGRLSCFGKVLSFRRDVAPATGVRNGVRTARMRITRNIPCTIHVAGEKLSIKYSSQPRSCRRCGGFGHFQGNCKEPRCYNCDTPGHRAMDCEESVLCGVCLRLSHPLSECPFVVFSANVLQSSYADAAKSPCPERTPEQREAMRAAAAVAAKEKEKQREQREKERQQQKEKEKDREKEKQNQKEKEKEKEREREKQREREREDRRKEDDRREREREERAKRRVREEEDDRRRDDDRNRGWERDRDWSRSRDRHSREREHERDYDRYRDRDDRYYYRDRDTRYRDHSPYPDDGRRKR